MVSNSWHVWVKLQVLFLGRYRKKAVGLFAATPRHSATSLYYGCGVSAAIPNAKALLLRNGIFKISIFERQQINLRHLIARFIFIGHHH
ncbi:MAG TPA: hypothetical protein VF677_15530 [Flavobacterium sp.]